MPRSLIGLLLLLFLAKAAVAQVAAPMGAITAPSPAQPILSFPVAPHDDVTIEWWYLNANLHTQSGRHFAVITSFFRFGNASGMVAKDSKIKIKQSHYLIYAVTDIDNKKHYTYSFGDRNTLTLLQEAATLALEQNPESTRLQNLVSTLDQGDFPPPTHLIGSECSIAPSPFAVDYGPSNEVKSAAGANRFSLKLGTAGTGAKVSLNFTGVKTPMLVNGDGNTGLRTRTDMKYISLTRNTVSGTIDLGEGPEAVTGDGWFDHQWGNSWTTQSAGWDWWGVQLGNGTDILFFRQLNLKTGEPFFPCATFEDSSGNQVTTHNIVFHYDASSIWKSPVTHVSYPLHWTVTFPDQNVTLDIAPDMQDQEMPVLANGGAIWEGSCAIAANVNGTPTPGFGYMELVGYGAAAVRAGISTAAGN